MERIAFDFNDVIFQTSKRFLEFNGERYRTNIGFNQFDGFFCNSLEITPEEVSKRWNLFFEDEKYGYSRPEEGVVDFLKKVKERRELVLVTGQMDIWQDHTVRWLDLHMKDIFDEVVILNSIQNNGKSKGLVCRDKSCLLLVDDDPRNIESCLDLGVGAVLYNQPWNKSYKKGLARIDSILDLNIL